MGADLVIKFNLLPEIAEKISAEVSDLVRKTAFDIEAGAKTIVPVDTGALKNSITSRFPGKHSAIVATHTDYAVYVEYGTMRMRAQPYMRPAAEKAAPMFFAALSRLEDLVK